MLFQVICTWIGNCKLQNSVRFMIVLLVLLMLKSLALIVEAVLWLLIFDRDQIATFARLLMSSCSEFINWICTQIIIWLVAMRYYESTIPIKRLSLNMQEQERRQTVDLDQPQKTKGIWLSDKKKRNRFNVAMLTIAVLVTGANFLWWGKIEKNIIDHKKQELHLFAGIAIFSSILFSIQIVNIALLATSYRTMKVAAKLLGIRDKKQIDQLCMMLFMTVFIALSFLAWFSVQSIALWLYVNEVLTLHVSIIVEEGARLVRVLCQQVAFMWILHNFSKYNAEVDKAMQKQRRRSTQTVSKPKEQMNKLYSS